MKKQLKKFQGDNFKKVFKLIYDLNQIMKNESESGDYVLSKSFCSNGKDVVINYDLPSEQVLKHLTNRTYTNLKQGIDLFLDLEGDVNFKMQGYELFNYFKNKEIKKATDSIRIKKKGMRFYYSKDKMIFYENEKKITDEERFKHHQLVNDIKKDRRDDNKVKITEEIFKEMRLNNTFTLKHKEHKLIISRSLFPFSTFNNKIKDCYIIFSKANSYNVARIYTDFGWCRIMKKIKFINF